MAGWAGSGLQHVDDRWASHCLYRSTPLINLSQGTPPRSRIIRNFFIASSLATLRGYAVQNRSSASRGQSSNRFIMWMSTPRKNGSNPSRFSRPSIHQFSFVPEPPKNPTSQYPAHFHNRRIRTEFSREFARAFQPPSASNSVLFLSSLRESPRTTKGKHSWSKSAPRSQELARSPKAMRAARDSHRTGATIRSVFRPATANRDCLRAATNGPRSAVPVFLVAHKPANQTPECAGAICPWTAKMEGCHNSPRWVFSGFRCAHAVQADAFRSPGVSQTPPGLSFVRRVFRGSPAAHAASPNFPTSFPHESQPARF